MKPLKMLLLLTLFIALAAAKERTYGSFKVKKFIRVIDGDTFVVGLSASYPRILSDSISVRIWGIDTPEMHSPDSTDRALALRARAFTDSLIRASHTILIEDVMRDKYFRLLGRVKCDTSDLGVELIRAGLAKPYFGGSKS